MIRILSVILALGLMSGSALAANTARPIESLHDLPAKWEGVAGGLLTKIPATFTIDKVTKVTRNDSGDGSTFSALYDVEATLNMGDRKVAVAQLSLNRYAANGNYEVVLFTNDELAGNLFAGIMYDEASDSWLLREIPRTGERRFSFTAPAKHAAH